MICRTGPVVCNVVASRVAYGRSRIGIRDRIGMAMGARRSEIASTGLKAFSAG